MVEFHDPKRPRGKHYLFMNIFVSYRRDDSASETGRICDRLIAEFGSDSVFTDVDSIPIGVDFREHLSDTIEQCHIMLVVIGDDWVNARNEQSDKRLNLSNDFVRLEIETALTSGIPIIPVLVGGSTMPTADELPLSIQHLAFRQGLPIRNDPDFHRDIDRLLGGISNSTTTDESNNQQNKRRAIQAVNSSASTRALNPFYLVLSPLLILLPLSAFIKGINIELSFLLIPISAWIGLKFSKLGLVVVTIMMIPALIYTTSFGGFRYATLDVGVYISVIVVCWIAANPQKWLKYLRILDPDTKKIYALLLVTFMVGYFHAAIMGAFGYLGWRGDGALFLLLVFSLGLSGKCGREVLIFSIAAALLSLLYFYLGYPDKFESTLNSGLTQRFRYTFDSIRHFYEILFVFMVGLSGSRIFAQQNLKHGFEDYLSSKAFFFITWAFGYLLISYNSHDVTGSNTLLLFLTFIYGVTQGTQAAVYVIGICVVSFLVSTLLGNIMATDSLTIRPTQQSMVILTCIAIYWLGTKCTKYFKVERGLV